ncbi:MAG TPA: alpha/beta hydrolase [Nevskiales bacterium]|nr:alpha/beta hydrolase [Nevskiales bacterium]
MHDMRHKAFARHAGCLALLLAILLCACGSVHLGRPEGPARAAPSRPVAYTVIRDIVVSPPGWPQTLLADLYRPDGQGPFPGIVLVHGGGWKRGDRGQVEKHAKRLAADGYLVLNTTYRLVPRAIFPAQLQDVQQAVLWMRRSGPQYGVDPARIGGFGYSAGAHLISLAAAVAGDREWGAEGTELQAIVAGGNPSDLSRYEGGKLVPAFLGTTQKENPELFRAASPLTHVRPGHPPVFQYHGTLDELVPIEQAYGYKAALDRAGVANELFILRGHGHISAFFADGDAIEAALAFLDRYLRHAQTRKPQPGVRSAKAAAR